MQYEKRQRGIIWSVVSAAAALALVAGLIPFAFAFAGDSDDTDEDLVVTSEPTLPTLDEEDAVGASVQVQESTGAAQGTATDVYIDKTEDKSVSHVKGVVEVTNAATNETTTVVVYSNSAPASYSDPRSGGVNTLVEEAVQAVIKYAKGNGYTYDENQPIGPDPAGGTTGKVWDNRKYETIEEGDTITGGVGIQTVSSSDSDYTRTHIASGDYGKEVTFTVTLKATADKTVRTAYNTVAGNGGSWTKGDGGSLGFTFKRDVNDDLTFMNFRGIQVDGNDVPSSAYTAKAGSVVLALSASYLETLSAGSHELTALFNDGVATATFEIEAAATKDSAAGSKFAPDALPATGDGTFAIAGMLLLAFVCAAAVIPHALKRRTL